MSKGQEFPAGKDMFPADTDRDASRGEPTGDGFSSGNGISAGLGQDDSPLDGSPLDGETAEALADLMRRRKAYQRGFARRQPERIADVIAQVVQQRGYARERSASQCEAAWVAAAGPHASSLTRLGALRRGTLEVVVANSLLLQELGFEKERLLAALQNALPEMNIKQIRFRTGPLG
jgi:hypothetical protein